jgi:hypothetical protein
MAAGSIEGIERPKVGIQIFGGDVEDLATVVPELGIDLTLAHLNWGGVEPEPGQRDWAALDWWDSYAATGAPMPTRIWTMYVVHMNERGPLPSDLRGTSFGAPEMHRRFEAFVADAGERTGWGDNGDIVLIANELDMWARSYPDEVPAFLDFLEAGADAIRRHAPGVRVINTVSNDILETDESRSLLKECNRATDLVAFDWYDLRPNLRVERLTDLEGLVQQWEEAAGGRQIIINEIGLPTGAGCASSEELQETRVHELFEVLNRRTRDQVEGAVWLGLDDWSETVMREWAANQFPGIPEMETFLSFLTTLGLRSLDRIPKLGYQAWVDEVARRRAG